MIVGEGTELFVEPVPSALEGTRLGESGIGARTGLNVVAVRHDGSSVGNPSADTELPAGAELVMLGTSEQHRQFTKVYA